TAAHQMGAAPSALTDSSSASLGQFGCHGNSSEKSQPLSTGSANSFAPSGHSRQSSSSSSATARLQQTLKRRVAWLRRRSSPDPAKQFRAFIADWSSADLRVLLDEFEALHALKDAHLGAAAARPQCSSLCQDLGCLLRTGLGSDARLILGDYPLDLCVPGGLDPELLRALLAYLYCGEVSLARLSAPATVAALCHELGAPGRLSDDLAQLLDTGHLADCVLIFEEAEPRARRIELPCHRALLACRSPFFAGVVEKRLAAARRHRRRRLVRCAVHGGGDGVGDAQLAEPPLALVLDEAVLPRRLAPAMLTCLYTDRLPDCLALRDLMDLHEIGRFLELPCLTRASEDLLVESLCPDTLVPVLDWSGAGTGSAWVHRQARLFLCEEFAALAVQAPRVLTQLSRRELLAALRSDFLQAAESDVLSALIAWGEAQVAARAAEIVA
uniref:BTB domain-containing protein n=1 Tax=Macrostomum lignano TaxID=282301 RepID=A0A1I8HLT9_9PLAT